MEQVASLKHGKTLSKKQRPMPYSQLEMELGEIGALQTCASGMYKKWRNKFGIDMVTKIESELDEKVEVGVETKKTRTDTCDTQFSL